MTVIHTAMFVMILGILGYLVWLLVKVEGGLRLLVVFAILLGITASVQVLFEGYAYSECEKAGWPSARWDVLEHEAICIDDLVLKVPLDKANDPSRKELRCCPCPAPEPTK